MHIERLQLTSFRGLLSADIPLQPGFNLIVGLNGAGKSSLLDAIRILAAQALQGIHGVPNFNLGFELEDIQHGRDAMQAELSFRWVDGNQYRYAVHKNREAMIPTAEGRLRDQTTDTPDKAELTSLGSGGTATAVSSISADRPASLPLLLYFSVARSRATHDVQRISKKANPAYIGALASDRGLRLKDMADWWRAREALALEDEHGISARQLAAVRQALQRLMPQFTSWHVDEDGLRVNKQVSIRMLDPESITSGTKTIEENRQIKISQLSDGERSMIAFVFDLSRRLAQLNERDPEPVANGKGVVLIDEIDLHLHPAWQRQITINLPRVFPGLQFIVTTHSPQVIGETEAGRVVVLREGGGIERQDESLGRDSGWILRHIMETTERNADLQAGLDAVDQLIGADKFTEARKQVDELRQRFGNEKELVGAAAEIARWEILGNEAHR